MQVEKKVGGFSPVTLTLTAESQAEYDVLVRLLRLAYDTSGYGSDVENLASEVLGTLGENT